MAHRQECPKWEHAQGGNVPHHAVEIGRSGVNGEMMYVARATIQGDLVPGKLVPSHKVAYFGNNMQEKGEHSYEVLVNCGNSEVKWKKAKNGQVPIGAIEAGKVGSTGEPLYIARGHPPPDPSGTHGGKVHPSHGCAYIGYNGTEHVVKEYEVLCQSYIYY